LAVGAVVGVFERAVVGGGVAEAEIAVFAAKRVGALVLLRAVVGVEGAGESVA
jgi:hypothetical protein